MNTRVRTSLFTFLCLLISCTTLNANNGSIAYIYPMTNITIDGQLNDWPVTLQRYSLNHIHYGEGIDGPEDGSAFWQGG